MSENIKLATHQTYFEETNFGIAEFNLGYSTNCEYFWPEIIAWQSEVKCKQDEVWVFGTKS